MYVDFCLVDMHLYAYACIGNLKATQAQSRWVRCLAEMHYLTVYRTYEVLCFQWIKAADCVVGGIAEKM